MIKFTSQDSYFITGRGKAFACLIPESLDGVNSVDIVNQTVLIDGNSYVVKGVERFLITGCYENMRAGTQVGLLVE